MRITGDGRGVARYVGVTMLETGAWEAGEIVLTGHAVLGPHVATESSAISTGALLTMCDNVAGFCGGLAALPDGWVQTVNLMVRRTRLDVAGPLDFVASVLRKGRRAIVTDVRVNDAAGLVAIGTLTSAVLMPEGGPPLWDRPARLDTRFESDGPLPPFGEWLGIEREDDRVTLSVRDDMRNPWGIVHGGVTASLIDAAAEHVVPGTRGVLDATVHYVAPSKVGPLAAIGEVIARRAGDVLVRVEVRDTGTDRTTALAVAAVESV